MSDRLEVDGVTPADRLEALREKLQREAKSAVADCAPYSLEARGKTEAIAIIEWVCKCVREQMSSMVALGPEEVTLEDI
jgi:hypothetical protein